MAVIADGILKSIYPWQHVPQNLSLPAFLSKEIEGEDLDCSYIYDLDSKTELSRRQILDESRKLASALLQNLKPRSGDHVAILLPNIRNYLAILLGVMDAGLVPVNFNPAWTSYELENMTRDLTFSAVISSNSQISKISEVTSMRKAGIFINVGNEESIPGHALDIDTLHYNAIIDRCQSHWKAGPETTFDGNKTAFVIFSSGTSGLPKGVKISHRNAIAGLMCWDRLVIGSAGDSVLTVFPFFHVAGIILMLRALFHGFKLVSMKKFVPQEYIKALKSHKLTMLGLPPTLMSFIANCDSLTKEDFLNVRSVFTAGAPLKEALQVKFCAKVGSRLIVQSCYGASELFGTVTAVPIKLASLGHLSVGHIIPNMEMKVVTQDTGVALGPFEKGELCFRGDTVSSGYLNNEEATKKVFDADGWYHSGDFGYYDSNGLVYIEGRIKDLIKVNANQVAPEEIENVIRKLDQVKDVVVFGIDDEKYGEVPRALVVRSTTCLTEDRVQDIVKDHLASYKQLRGGVRFVDQLPISAIGKVVRREARRWDSDNAANAM